MKIGVITHTLAGRGGIEQVVRTQVDGLRARGHEVQVLAGPSLGSGFAARAGSAAGLAFRSASALRRCDVVLSHYQPAAVVAQRTGVPFVQYLHHPLRAAHPTATQRQSTSLRLWNLAGRGLAGIDRRSVRAAHSVAVPTMKVAEETRRIYGLEPHVLPLGIDTETFTAGTSTPAPRSLLFVGRPEERYKHLDWAIEVALRLRRPLEVVGEAKARSVPGVDVTWHGFLSGAELVDVYRRAGVLLFPSVHEDFGLVPLEAMACGLPVVGWDDGHGPSTTLASGSGGVLVPPYDLDAFTAAVSDVLRIPGRRDALAAAGPRWVKERFSVERHLDGLLELLESAAGQKAAVS